MLSFKPAFSLSSLHFTLLFHFDQESLQFLFTFCHKGGVICISEVIDISPGELDFSLCFIQLSISHDVLCAVLCLVTQSCLTLCNPMDCSPPGYSVHGDSPGKNTGVGCHFFLQGIFLTQGLNPGLLHCRQILYCLSHQGSPHFPKE